jgi:hypothetical protein
MRPPARSGGASRATARPVGWTAPTPGAWPAWVARIYEALVPLTCRGCGETIVPGEHFTRRAPTGGATEAADEGTASSRGPVCRTCRPFQQLH